jgi:L-cysteine desulfidase
LVSQNDREIARLEQQQQQQQQQISHFNYEVSPQSNETLKRILSFINEVTPELKKQNDTSSIELNKHEQNPGLTSETEFEFTREVHSPRHCMIINIRTSQLT